MSSDGCTMGDWLKPPLGITNEDGEVTLSTRPALRFGHCGICGARLAPDRRPQLLPCLHSLCQPCASQSLGVGYGACPRCPLCGVKYSSENVTHDLFYNKSLSDQSRPTVKCGGCGGAGPGGWCVECAESLCPTCVTAHQRVRVTRNHTILGRPENPPADLAETARCSIHEREAAVLFCQSCDRLICGICEQSSHRGHRYQLLMKAMVEERIAIKPLVERVKQQKTKVREYLSDMDRRHQDLKELQTKLNNELRAAVLKIRDALLKQAVTISLEIQELCVSEERKILERREELTKLEEQLAYFLSLADGALGAESHVALLPCKQKLLCQIQDLASRNLPLDPSTVTATLCLDEDICSKIQAFGKLAVKTVPFACTDDQNGHGKLEPPHKIESSASLAVSSSVLTAQTTLTSSFNVSSHHVSPTSSSILPNSGPLPPTCYQILSSFSPIPPTSQQICSTSYPVTPTSSSILSTSSQIPSSSCQILPTSSQIPSTSSSIPTSSQIPPTSSLVLPTSSQIPLTSSHIPPMYLYIPPASCQIRPNSQLATSQVLPTSPHIPSTYFYMPPTSSQIHPNSQLILQTSSPVLSISPQKPPTLCSKAQISDPPLHSGPLVLSTLKARCPTLPHPVSPSAQMPLLVPFADKCPAYFPPRQAKYLGPPLVVNLSLPCGPPLPIRLPTPPTMLVPLTAPFQPQPAEPNSRTSNDGVPAGCPAEPNEPMLNTNIPVGSTPETSYQKANTSVPVGLPPETNCRMPNTSTSIGASPETNSPIPKAGVLVVSPPEANDQTPKAGVLVFSPPEANGPMPKAGLPVVSPPKAKDRTPKARVPVGLPPEPKGRMPNTSIPSGFPPEPNGQTLGTSTPVGSPGLAGSTSQMPSGILDSFGSGLQSAPLMGREHDGDPFGAPVEEDDDGGELWEADTESFPEARKGDGSTPVASPGLAGSTPQMPSGILDPFGSQSAPLMGHEHDGDPFGAPVEEDDDSDEMWEADTESFPEARKGDGRPLDLRVSLARLPVSFPPPGGPQPRFRLTPGIDKREVILEQIPEEVQILPPLKLSRCRKKRCAICHEAGVLSRCTQCGRSFHSDCHLTPISTTDSDHWQCMVCQDQSDMRDQQGSLSEIQPGYDLPDQRECKHLFLALISQKHSALLYQQPEFMPDSSCYVDVTLIRDRLLQKLSPAYIPSEFASDVWLLLDSLPKRPQDVKSVEKLRRIFQKALSKTFGSSLHPSLLGPLPGKEGEGTTKRKKKRKRKRKEPSVKEDQEEPLRKKLCKDPKWGEGARSETC